MPRARTPSRQTTPRKRSSTPTKRRSPSKTRPVKKEIQQEEVPVASPKTTKVFNPETKEYEFMGPYIGPLGIVFGLPLLVWGFSYFANGSLSNWTISSLMKISENITWNDIVTKSYSTEAMYTYIVWFLFQLMLHVTIPGREVDGVELRNGKKLKYVINGWNCLLTTAILIVVCQYYVPGFDLVWLADNVLPMATASIIFSFALSIYLYISSFTRDQKNKSPKLLAEGGNSGKFLYDFFIGRELNPRISFLGKEVDLKYFCELRPGLFLWVILVWSYALKQFRINGHIDPGMAVVVLLQSLYVADSVYCEECILTTMDIIQDGFGFMLAFGDLAWVPFTYSLQAHFLADIAGMENMGTPLYWAIFCLAVGATGFYIFRSANAQKDTFKKDPTNPSVRNLKFITTKTGSKLLCDGWWGFARHVNYTGDWLLSIGMSLPTRFFSPLTYFYPVYFAVLLIHREMRDEHKCANKYKDDWVEYKKRVPHRFCKFIW